MKRFFGSPRRASKPSLGQGMVEFALVFPLLIAVILAIMEFGFYLMTSLTIQNATREGARLASTLIDLEANDPRVITFVEDLIPDFGPFTGFVGGTTNTGITDCETSDLITVNVSGTYTFVPDIFVGLNGIYLEFPATTHYELCGVFPLSETAVPTAPPGSTETTGPTETFTTTPSVSLTPSNTTSATVTPTPSRTFTASNTPTLTPTVYLIAAPEWVGGTYYRDGNDCDNINLTIGASNSWYSVPGYGPYNYARYVNGSSYGTQSANFPHDVTWNTGIDLRNGQTIVFEWIANFSGGLQSQVLWKSWQCWYGNMTAQDPPTPTPTPSNTPTPTNTGTATYTPSNTPTRTPSLTPSNTPTRTSSPTASNTFTPSNTPTRTPTATKTYTPSRTPTPSTPPSAPDYVTVNYSHYNSNCSNIAVTWKPDSSWSSYPGYGPNSYLRYRNGYSAGSQAANYPNNVTWNTGDWLSNGQSITYGFEADFGGGLISNRLEVSYYCWYGWLITN